jgi:hypothetical protein
VRVGRDGGGDVDHRRRRVDGDSEQQKNGREGRYIASSTALSWFGEGFKEAKKDGFHAVSVRNQHTFLSREMVPGFMLGSELP